MNNFKNTVIVVLSLIILVQAAFLISLLSQREKPVRKKAVAKTERVVPKRLIQKKEEVRHPAPSSPAVVAPVIVARPALPDGRTTEGQAKIVLVIDDWGYNLKNRGFIINNDFHVTLSILPFKTFSTTIAQMAFHKNKDIIIHMPMEPKNKDSYGLEDKTLLTGMDKKTVLRLLRDAESSVPFANGISNHMGSKATQDPVLMTTIMEYLRKRGLFFLDSLVTPDSVAKGIAQKLRVGFAARDIFIDNESDPVYIRGQLTKLAREAYRKGIAIGIGHDRPSTIAVLNEMIPQLEAQGYKFINLSDAIKEPQ